MMRVRDFYALLESETEPDASMLPSLEKLVEKYPLFQAGIFIYIKCLYLTDAANYVAELNRLTPFVHDRRALFYYVLSEVYERFQKKPQNKQLEDRTNILINAFFETNNIHESIGNDPLAYTVQHPSMASFDYLSYIGLLDNDSSLNITADLDSSARETSTPKMRGQDMIDHFIERADELEGPIIPKRNKEDLSLSEDVDFLEEESEDDFFFTQTLIDIYIKQKKYDRAYEIIKRLSLNYPEKNIYFADQLKFLQKQIGN